MANSARSSDSRSAVTEEGLQSPQDSPPRDKRPKSIKQQQFMIKRTDLLDHIRNYPNSCFKLGGAKTKIPLGCIRNPCLRLSLCRSNQRDIDALTLIIDIYFPAKCNRIVFKAVIQVNITIIDPRTNSTIKSESVLLTLREITTSINRFFPYTAILNSECVAFKLQMEIFLCEFFPDDSKTLHKSNMTISLNECPDDEEMIDITTVRST